MNLQTAAWAWLGHYKNIKRFTKLKKVGDFISHICFISSIFARARLNFRKAGNDFIASCFLLLLHPLTIWDHFDRPHDA